MSNEPDDDFDEEERRDQEQEDRRQVAKAVIAYLCGALRFFGVEKVVVAFNGAFGDASIDAPVYYPALAGDLPFGLASRIGRLWEDFLPHDWHAEIGTVGTIAIDVRTGKVTVDISYINEEDWDGDEME